MPVIPFKTQLLKVWQTPLQLTAIYLGILACLAVILKVDSELLLNQLLRFVLLTLGFGLPSVIVHKMAAFKYPFFVNRLISILILFLIVDESQSGLVIFGVGLAAGLIKHFVRLNRLPVFNPAAVGLVVAALFGVYDTWWGTSFAPRFSSLELSVAVLFTLPLGGYLAYKYRKLPITLSFLGLFTLVTTLWQQRLPLTLILEGTVLFFALIMITEPKTTPAVRNQQLIFGATVGLLSAIFIRLVPLSPYALALMIGNAGFRMWQWWQLKSRIKVGTIPNPPVMTPTAQEPQN